MKSNILPSVKVKIQEILDKIHSKHQPLEYKISFEDEVEAFIAYVKSQPINPDLPLVFWIDLFCGAGGTSTGIHLADTPNMFVAACVNHDLNAINSHKENHPHTIHFREDIRDFEVVRKLKIFADRLRQEFPGCIINIWASLECTNFSNAKGGQARDADSRSLADHMEMYIVAIKPEYFWVENVREFMAWGPLDAKGKPVSRTAGKDYVRWTELIKSHGYKGDHQILNAANYGAYQSRERLFIQFAANGMPISWPEQTHTKDKRKGGMFDLPKWKAVREVLDLWDEGKTIFARKKALSENTLKRIYAGLEKFVAKGEKGFTSRYNSGSDINRVKSLDEPVGAIPTNNSHAIIQTNQFMVKNFTGDPKHLVTGIDQPSGTIKTRDSHSLVNTNFITKYFSGRPEGKVIGVDGPAGTVTTAGGQTLVSATHLNTYYGNGGVYSVDGPAPTLSTKDRVAKVDVKFIDQQYGASLPASIDKPVGALTANPKFALVSAEPWIMDTNFQNVGRSIDEPANTVTASRHYPYLVNTNSSTTPPIDLDNPSPSITSRTHLLINPSWISGHVKSIDEPCMTIIARQDKSPLSLLSVEHGPVMAAIYEDDSPTMIKIKEFCVLYGITDIKMRMLNIPELKRIQGFPEDYILKGTQTEQKKYIGNAVEVTQAKVLVSANYEAIVKHFRKQAA